MLNHKNIENGCESFFGDWVSRQSSEAAKRNLGYRIWFGGPPKVYGQNWARGINKMQTFLLPEPKRQT